MIFRDTGDYTELPELPFVSRRAFCGLQKNAISGDVYAFFVARDPSNSNAMTAAVRKIYPENTDNWSTISGLVDFGLNMHTALAVQIKPTSFLIFPASVRIRTAIN